MDKPAIRPMKYKGNFLNLTVFPFNAVPYLMAKLIKLLALKDLFKKIRNSLIHSQRLEAFFLPQPSPFPLCSCAGPSPMPSYCGIYSFKTTKEEPDKENLCIEQTHSDVFI